MTIKQFIEEAKKIGHRDEYISAQVEGNFHAFLDSFEVQYKIWCAGCKKHTLDYDNPEDALAEFRVMHGAKSITNAAGQDMVLTEETHEN